MSRHRWLMLLMLVLTTLALAACGDDDDDGSGGGGEATTQEESTGTTIQKNAKNGSTKIVVGSKNFTEQKVLGEIYAQALGAADYTVEKQLNLGDEKTALKAIERNTINAYPE
jgi:osmoprotectant transport system substrate-binding protein